MSSSGSQSAGEGITDEQASEPLRWLGERFSTGTGKVRDAISKWGTTFTEFSAESALQKIGGLGAGMARAAHILRSPQAAMAQLEYANERTYLTEANSDLAALEKNEGPSLLGVEGCGAQAVMDRVVAHAQAAGKFETVSGEATPGKLTRKDLERLVRVGEGVYRAIYADRGQDVAHLTLPGSERPLASPYTCKALAWFLAAQAAKQDVVASLSSKGNAQGRSDLESPHTWVMKDPGGRLHAFLKAVPTAAPRLSDYMAAHSLSPKASRWDRLFGADRRQQGAIEDYQSTFPGAGGSLHFDQLAASKDSSNEPELFIRFDKAGRPPCFASSGGSSGDSGGPGTLLRFFAAFGRNMDHFMQPRKAGTNDAIPLSDDLNNQFKTLIQDAVTSKICGEDALPFAKGAVKYDLPFLKKALEHLEQRAKDEIVGIDVLRKQNFFSLAMRSTESEAKMRAIEARCGLLLQKIQEEERHMRTHDHIARRGSEVHLLLEPGDTALGSTTPGCDETVSEQDDTDDVFAPNL